MPIKVKRALGRQVMEDAVRKGGSVTVDDGRRFTVIEDRLFLRVYYEKSYEPLLTAIAEKLVEQGDVIVDVGANFGWYTTLFGKCSSPGGKVISYEPSPHSYRILTENIELNKMETAIDARALCVGEFSGTTTLEQGFASESGLSHVVADKTESTYDVKVVALDEDLNEEIGKIAYIKIDVEGYEYRTLRGARRIIDVVDQPIIQIELNDEALTRAGNTRADVIDLLGSHGYSFWAVTPGRPGFLQETDAINCSDAFCIGRGRYGERINKCSGFAGSTH